MRKTLTLTFVMTLIATLALAQEPKKKPLSPPAKAEARIAGKKLTVDYSAPSMRGRKIMGELVPYGKVWRTGANAATTLTTPTDLMLGSVHLKAGTYTLFTIPGEKEWTLIVNKKTGQWGTDYVQSEDVGRVKMKVQQTKKPVETFAIAIKPTVENQGLLTLSWENTEASVPVVVH